MKQAVAFAVVALSLALAGCASQRATATTTVSERDRPAAGASSGRAQESGPPYRRLLAALASDGPALAANLSVEQVYQGGALRVQASPALSGTATILGRTTILQPVPGGLEGLVGFGTQDPPGPTTLTLAVTGPGGALGQATRTVVVLRTRWTTDYITLPPPPPPDPNAPPPPPDETPLLPVLYAGVTPRKWTDGWFAPLPPPLAVTGYFGEQRSFNGGPVGGHHGGTDLGAEARTPVFATNDGVVAMSGLYAVRGNIVAIDHGSGVFSLYGHLRERVVQVGDKVTKGQVIGYVGSTGQSTGPHLHWEMAVGGILVDGLRWLDGSQGF